MGRSFKEMDFTILERGVQIKFITAPPERPGTQLVGVLSFGHAGNWVKQASSGMNLPFSYSAPNPGNKKEKFLADEIRLSTPCPSGPKGKGR